MHTIYNLFFHMLNRYSDYQSRSILFRAQNDLRTFRIYIVGVFTVQFRRVGISVWT